MFFIFGLLITYVLIGYLEMWFTYFTYTLKKSSLIIDILLLTCTHSKICIYHRSLFILSLLIFYCTLWWSHDGNGILSIRYILLQMDWIMLTTFITKAIMRLRTFLMTARNSEISNQGCCWSFVTTQNNGCGLLVFA